MGLSARATLETLAVMVVVFVVQQAVVLVLGLGVMTGLFVLDSPVPLLEPWTLVTSVYAHGGPGHLLANGLMLLLVGIGVEQVTTRARFHGFFVVTGALAGLSQVWFHVLSPVSEPHGVLGASGAIFALLGYLVAGNTVADELVAGFELDFKAQMAAIAVVGAALTLAFVGPGIANVGHFAGLLLGLLTGRMRLIHVDDSPGVSA